MELIDIESLFKSFVCLIVFVNIHEVVALEQRFLDSKYSRTSIARTWMACLLWLIRTCF